MTTDPHRPVPERPQPQPPQQPRRRKSNVFWMLFLGGTLVLVVLAVLPVIATFIAVAMWGTGSSGSNK